MQGLKQSTAITYPVFVHDAAGDPVTGLTNASFIKTISKNGGAFGAMTVTITELADGWYSVPISASHTDTLGMLSITLTNAGAKQVNLQWRVSVNIPDDLALASVNTEARLSEMDAGTGGKMANQVDIIQIDTTTDIPAQITTAQNDLDKITGADGTTLATAQGNYAPSKAGDAMAITAGGVDDIWDEVLTAASHNVPSSAGRRLRQIQEFTYEGGAVWIDTVNGTAGTVNFENGTVENPVNNIADANTIASSLGLVKFSIFPGSSITFVAAQNNQLFHGSNWTLALGGQDVAGTMIKGATVSGIAAGVGTRQTFKNCFMNATTLIANTHLTTCAIMATLTVGEAGDYFMDRCHSAIAGVATWIFDFGGAIGNTNLSVRNYSGGIQVENMGDVGTDTMSLEGFGQFIEGTCTGGTVAIRGVFTTSGITNLTLSEIARLDVDHIADVVWDEILTGATHNIATSAGRRLRGIQEFQGYEFGAVWIDTINGTAGTTNFENGTVENPVDTIADANTLATSLGLSIFHVSPGSSITFAAAQDNQLFIGSNWILALGGQSIVGTEINGAQVSGIAAGVGSTQIFRDCIMGAVSHIKDTHLVRCAIAGTQTMVEAGDIFFDICHSAIAGTATWVFQFGALIGNTNLNMRHYSGGVQLEGMGDTGTDTASIEGQGQIIEGTCAGGTVAVRGNFTKSGITNITLSDDARIDVDQIGDATWDEPKAGHVAAGSMGEEIQSHALSTEISALNDLSLADIFTYAIEGAATFEQFQRIMYAALAGKSTGGGTLTLTFRDLADLKARITATVNTDGNRTAMTVDGS